MKEFDRIIGYEDVKIELYRVVDMMKNPQKYRELGVKTTRGLLLSGEPGVGKTLMAKCLIDASGRNAYTLRKNIPDGDFVKEIHKTFNEAKDNAPSIIFLDDMDKFANGDRHHRNEEEYVTIQSCVDEVKDDEVFVLATVNELENLPDSLLRPGRFDKTITVEFPTGDDAEAIVEYYLEGKKIADDIDFKEVSKLLNGRSCAALETVLNEAGVYAGYENRQLIEMEDIVKSFTRVVYDAPEMIQEYKSPYLRNTAVHEAGHTVVAEILENESVNIVSIKKHGGSIGGFTSYINNEDYFADIRFMENRIMALLAGKAATELVYGSIDTGTTSDIHRAYDVLDRFVEDYCAYGFNGIDHNPSMGISDSYNRKVDMVQKQLDGFYLKAKKILIENREFLDKLTDELVKKQILSFRDIQSIKKNCKITVA